MDKELSLLLILIKFTNAQRELPERDFYDNKKRFVEGEEYFLITKSLMSEKRTFGIEVPNRGITVLTESGYLLLVKTFTDDLSWEVQKQLVNSYFKLNEITQDFNSNYPIDIVGLNDFISELKDNLPCVYAQINSIENSINEVVDNMTLNVRQQEIIHEAARKRINYLLGGAHSIEYKRNSRMYMINLWNGLKATLHCGSSYKDLNPKDFNKAISYIENWVYEK